MRDIDNIRNLRAEILEKIDSQNENIINWKSWLQNIIFFQGIRMSLMRGLRMYLR